MSYQTTSAAVLLCTLAILSGLLTHFTRPDIKLIPERSSWRTTNLLVVRMTSPLYLALSWSVTIGAQVVWLVYNLHAAMRPSPKDLLHPCIVAPALLVMYATPELTRLTMEGRTVFATEMVDLSSFLDICAALVLSYGVTKISMATANDDRSLAPPTYEESISQLPDNKTQQEGPKVGLHIFRLNGVAALATFHYLAAIIKMTWVARRMCAGLTPHDAVTLNLTLVLLSLVTFIAKDVKDAGVARDSKITDDACGRHSSWHYVVTTYACAMVYAASNLMASHSYHPGQIQSCLASAVFLLAAGALTTKARRLGGEGATSTEEEECRKYQLIQEDKEFINVAVESEFTKSEPQKIVEAKFETADYCDIDNMVHNV